MYLQNLVSMHRNDTSDIPRTYGILCVFEFDNIPLCMFVDWIYNLSITEFIYLFIFYFLGGGVEF